MVLLKEFVDNIWVYDGEVVQWYSLPYTTRMTIVKLASGDLWIHSPAKITEALLQELHQLGKPTYLIAPNKIHHLYLPAWQQQFPEATIYAAPGLQAKRPDIRFCKDLEEQPEPEWQQDLDQLIFRGSTMMEEVVFFHKITRTLILTDLIENFPRDHFTGYQKLLAQATGILAPHGQTPLDWRLSYTFQKKLARSSLATILTWQPERIIIAHGECIQEQGTDFLRRSFRWLQPELSEVKIAEFSP